MKINKLYRNTGELPEIIPVFPLSGVLLLPTRELPLNIFEPRYLAMADEALRTHRLVGMIQPLQDESQDSTSPKLEKIGCCGRITQFGETGDGRYFMTLTGIARFIVKAEIRTDTPYRLCRIDFEPYAKDLFVAPNFRGTNEVDLKRVIDLLENVRGIKIDKRAIESASVADVVDILAMQLQFGAKEKQALLEATDTAARCEMLIAIAELEIAEKAGIRHKLQ